MLFNPVEKDPGRFSSNLYILSHSIKAKIKNRNNIRRLWQSTGATAYRIEMNRLSAKIKSEIKSFKNNKWKGCIQSLAPSDNSIWNYLRRVRKPFVLILILTFC